MSDKELIMNYEGELYNLCYEIIDGSENLLEDFQMLCEEGKYSPIKKQYEIKEHIQSDERKILYKIYEGKIEGIISEVVNKVNYGVVGIGDFYSELLNQYKRTFSDIKELAIAFEKTIKDPHIPFVYLGLPLSMPADIYKEYIQNNEDNIQKILYVLKLNYTQKTEEASILVKILDEITDYNDKVVVFSVLLDILKRGGVVGLMKEIMLNKDRDNAE